MSQPEKRLSQGLGSFDDVANFVVAENEHLEQPIPNVHDLVCILRGFVHVEENWPALAPMLAAILNKDARKTGRFHWVDDKGCLIVQQFVSQRDIDNQADLCEIP